MVHQRHASVHDVRVARGEQLRVRKCLTWEWPVISTRTKEAQKSIALKYLLVLPVRIMPARG